MYSIVLMAATAAGPTTPAADVAASTVAITAPAVAAGCCGGYVASYGCCGGYSYGCCGGRGGLFHHKHKGGCCGGYVPSYGCGGWSCFGSCYGSYTAGCWGSCYGSYSWGGPGGCYGAYSYHYGCYGSTPYGGIYAAPFAAPAAPAVVIPQDTPAVPTNPAPTNPLPKKTGSEGASLRFQLPADATLFVDGQKAAGAGAERAFYTPPLQPGQRYFYDVKAELLVNGQKVVEEKRVIVTAGAQLVETFPRLTAAATDPATVAGR
jgi:uncharacterized protein (TIGR03000 family)